MVKAKNTAKWEVGDLVQILPKDPSSSTELIGKGEILSIQGAGWYSVRLFQMGDSSPAETTIKCRGNRLERLAFDINDAKTVPNPNRESTTKKSLTTSVVPPLSLQEEEFESQLSIETYNEQIHDEFEVDSTPAIHDLDAIVSKIKDGTSSIYGDVASNSQIEERLLEQVAHHSTYEHWVVLTDLHCSPSTLDTCLEVLNIVHETAISQPQKCGILFLGDFWHHRGTLRVDCLNAVLEALANWKVPMVMIPGNHDQVTLGGDNHGLTPLANAYRVGESEGSSVAGPLILSNPTIFRKALFVPHVRNLETLRLIVGSSQAQTASALFLHTEVKGAMMNDLVVSTHGISPSVFPSHKNIYSGHFHKPHIVQSTNKQTVIEYLGSPYQVSLAEAHQEKQLVILDSDWKCEQRIPISVGRRHFKLSSTKELETIQVLENDDETSSAAVSKHSICVKKGDRIVLTHPAGTVSETDTDAPWKSHVNALRKKGLMVEVREAAMRDNDKGYVDSITASSMPGFEELSPESVWRAYLKDASDSIPTEDDAKALLTVGLEILEEIEGDEWSASLSNDHASQRELKLTSLSVEGFGPFEDTIDYPLENRGLVLLRGSNSDSGPDSNGTGKSSLAMATLWALTGSLDARPAADLKVADVVNDNSKLAKVTVRGYINDSPFCVTRSKTASRGGDLTFSVNDIDLTTQSAKETQAVVEAKLGVNAHILTRVAFYGQHGMNDLLEATDSKLKEELSMLVPLELWQQATSLARLKSRQARKRVDEIEGMVRLRQSDIDALSAKLARAKQTREYQQRNVIEAEERLNRELARIQDLMDKTSSTNVEELQSQLDDASMDIRMLHENHESTTREKESHLKPLEEELMEAREGLASLTRQSTQLEMDACSAKQSLETAKLRMTRIREKWSLDASHDIPEVLKAPEYCPTCKQPLRTEDDSEEHIHNVQQTMETEIREAQDILALANETCQAASVKSSEYVETLATQEAVVRDLQSNHQEAASEWNYKFQALQAQLVEKRNLQNTLTSRLSMLVKESQLFAAKESAKVAFQTEQLNAAHAEETYQNLKAEWETSENFLKQIQSEQKEEIHRQALLSGVGERFSAKGVQTFLLQNTVETLQNKAQFYLSSLSEDSQRLGLQLETGDKILRTASIRGNDGEFRQRPLSTLSGGQWRRCSLAFSLAFMELVAQKGKLSSSLLVLDEPLTHLDRSGRSKFGELIRSLLSNGQLSTAIVILQDLSAEELEEAFDGIDTVVRKGGKSRLELDDMASKEL